MAQIFGQYSPAFDFVRAKNGYPFLCPKSDPTSISRTLAIVHRDTQIISFLAKRNYIKGIFELGCDAGHLLALAEWHGIYAIGMDIDTGIVKTNVSNGISCYRGDLQELIMHNQSASYYKELLATVKKRCNLIAFQNFTHVTHDVDYTNHSTGEKNRHELFSWSSKHFEYILCSLYDDDIEDFEGRYGLKLVHNFSNAKAKFTKSENMITQYASKKRECCLETYINLQKLFQVQNINTAA